MIYLYLNLPLLERKLIYNTVSKSLVFRRASELVKEASAESRQEKHRERWSLCGIGRGGLAEVGVRAAQPEDPGPPVWTLSSATHLGKLYQTSDRSCEGVLGANVY